MPRYQYQCPQAHTFLKFSTVAEHSPLAQCACGDWAAQVITAPLLVTVSADVCYDSPIDGRPITSHDAWREDLKRHDCVPYDPGMRQDYDRRQADSDARLEQSIDAHVEQAIMQMPTATRAKLYSELTEQGMTADVVRSTPGA